MYRFVVYYESKEIQSEVRYSSLRKYSRLNRAIECSDEIKPSELIAEADHSPSTASVVPGHAKVWITERSDR